jgi:hypothetical protein
MPKQLNCNNEEPKTIFFCNFFNCAFQVIFVQQALHWHSLWRGSSIVRKLVHLVICHNVNNLTYFPFPSKIFESISWECIKTYHKIHEIGNPNLKPLWTLKIPKNGNFNWPTWLQWSSWHQENPTIMEPNH